MPLAELAQEARAAADFVVRRWWCERGPDGNVVTPGLEQADKVRRLPSGTAVEILELIDAVQQAHRNYKDCQSQPVSFSRRYACKLLGLVPSSLDTEYDDANDLLPVPKPIGSEPPHAPLERQLERAVKLVGTCAQSSPVAADLEAELAASLRDLQAFVRATEAQTEALLLRNRLAQALHERLGAVRRAAREVFRRYPAIVREVTSAYDRERRAVHRARTRALGSLLLQEGEDVGT